MQIGNGLADGVELGNGGLPAKLLHVEAKGGKRFFGALASLADAREGHAHHGQGGLHGANAEPGILKGLLEDEHVPGRFTGLIGQVGEFPAQANGRAKLAQGGHDGLVGNDQANGLAHRGGESGCVESEVIGQVSGRGRHWLSFDSWQFGRQFVEDFVLCEIRTVELSAVP